ncbi:MAG: AAA family ATPase, partial [Pseudomonadota bacterium]|nr:AAA family ATPase [Pseudomonadota bacterium]
MAKQNKTFSCSACGSSFTKWSGRCDGCGEWNTIVEDTPLSAGPASKSLGGKRGAALELTDLSTEEAPPPRTQSGLDELDRVLGGGLVPASAILVGGDPGIGKSTLLLQAAARFAQAGLKTIYVSGEEAADQVRLRARRLGLGQAPVRLAAATSVRDILTTLSIGTPPALLIIDSIQTMHSDLIEGAPGTVSQVRASGQELIRFAKERGTAVVLVGHVTKDGSIAGPRVLEHMVDTVLAFEGERSHQY